MILEAAITQYLGRKEKIIRWVERVKGDVSIVDELYLGEFLYYNGNRIEILPANRSLTNLED